MKEDKEETYLGEVKVEIADSPFACYKPSDWACLWITKYGQVDGSHHKAWVLDQVMRILKGGEIELTQASWSSGYKEWRFSVYESEDYKQWVNEMLDPDENGEPTYYYDNGIAC